MNAKFSFHNNTSSNGGFFADLAVQKYVIDTNTYLHKRAGKHWTYIDPCGAMYQLDYILVHCEWRNRVLDVELYSTFASIGSDHRTVTAELCL